MMALVPMVWLWIFDVAFWFYCYQPAHQEVLPLMERLGFFRLGTPDYAYVTIAMVLMGMFITYIVLAYTKWKSPGLMKIKPIGK